MKEINSTVFEAMSAASSEDLAVAVRRLAVAKVIELFLAEASIDAIRAETGLAEFEVWRILRDYIPRDFWGFNEA